MEQAFYNPGVQILTIQAVSLSSSWEKLSFSAPYWRLYWNQQPGAGVVWKSHQTALRPDRLVLIPPNTAFRGICPGRPRHLYLHFLAGAPFDSVWPGIYETPARGQLRDMAETLTRGDGHPRPNSLLALALIHAALVHVPESAIRPAPADLRIARALQAMDANLQQPLSNVQLAEIAQVSTNTFLRLFREQTGSTPQAVYMRKRIDHSCMQLHFTELKLDRVAQLAGFCDRYHFSRTFKRLRGIGPAAFRRQSAYLR